MVEYDLYPFVISKKMRRRQIKCYKRRGFFPFQRLWKRKKIPELSETSSVTEEDSSESIQEVSEPPYLRIVRITMPMEGFLME